MIEEWIQKEMGTIDLGDLRRERRIKSYLQSMWQKPQASTKAACKGWAETMAAYRLLDSPAVTDQVILKAHQDQVAERIKSERLLLYIQDTTELDFSKRKKLEGAGPLSELDRTGFFAHNEYVLGCDGVPLGLWHSSISARNPEEHGDRDKRKQLPIEQKESYRWLEGYRRACEMANSHPRACTIEIGDRENDIYEVFQEHAQRVPSSQKFAHFIIRCSQNRSLILTQATEQESQNSQPDQIKEAIAAAPILGSYSLALKQKAQWKKKKGKLQWSIRSQRDATLEMRACMVELDPPYRQAQKLQPVKLWVLMAREINPPPGEDPIEWILLTDFKIGTFKKALQIIRLYCLRWQIEIFHKILKSGCRVEKNQLQKAERLQPRIALQMIIAWRLHYVTLLGRYCPDLPCSCVFESFEWKPVLLLFQGKAAPNQEPSLSKMLNWIGMLGGHLGRKGDGDPGPETIWRGMSRVHDFALVWTALVS